MQKEINQDNTAEKEMSLFFGNSQIGKSTFVRQLTVGCMCQGKKTLFIDPNETKESLYKRLAVISAAKEDIDELHNKVISSWLDMSLVFSNTKNTDEILNLICHAHAEFGISVVVIDGLDQLDWGEERFSGSFFKSLKGLAIEYSVHIHLVWKGRKDLVLEKLNHSYVDYVYELERYSMDIYDDEATNKKNNSLTISTVRQKTSKFDCFKKALFFDEKSQQLLSGPEEIPFTYAISPIDYMLDLECESPYMH